MHLNAVAFASLSGDLRLVANRSMGGCVAKSMHPALILRQDDVGHFLLTFTLPYTITIYFEDKLSSYGTSTGQRKARVVSTFIILRLTLRYPSWRSSPPVPCCWVLLGAYFTVFGILCLRYFLIPFFVRFDFV